MTLKVSFRHASLVCGRLQNRTSLLNASVLSKKEVLNDGFDRSFCFMAL